MKTIVLEQQSLFPELDPFITKEKNIDYVDISKIKNIGAPAHSNDPVKYSILPEGRYILFKSGGENTHMPKLGKCFPYIQNTHTGKILALTLSGSYGYPRVTLNGEGGRGKTIIIHRTIALAFIENDMPDKKWHVDHKNGNPLDYRVQNLRWATPSQNNTGLKKKLKKNMLAKIRIAMNQ